MRNIKLVIEYDGMAYHGWQSQVNASSVQDVIISSLRKITGEDITLNGASRTDAGVHANGQVANFFTSSSIPPDKFAFALNSTLPDDIVIKKSEEAGPEFHSRYSAVGKKYTYLIYNSIFPSAIMRNRAYHVSRLLDFNAMECVLKYIVGTHDFSAFMASGSSIKTTVRTIYKATINKEPVNMSSFNEDNIIRFEISGDGFLYNMVRIIVGTLIYAGCGKIEPDAVPEIIEGKDRRKAGKTAPAYGLYLNKVYYTKSEMIAD